MANGGEVLIFVEGDSDKRFVKDLIASLRLPECEVDVTRGKGGLGRSRQKIEKAIDKNNTVLIIFDANGDNNESRDYIKKILGDTFLDNNIFLFPDNKRTGELETLLKKIVHSNYAFVMNCYEDYKTCLRNNGSHIHIPSGKKDLKWGVYAYCQAVAKTDPKETNYQNSDHWDLDNPALKPLKDFLTAHIPSA